MRRKLFFILAILLLLAGIMPWVNGFIFKSQFEHYVQAFNDESKMQARISSYQLGWLSSRAKIVLEANDMGSSATNTFLNPQLLIEADIEHGPLVYNKRTKHFLFAQALIANQVHIQPIESVIGLPLEKGLIQATTVATYNNHYFIDFSSPPFLKEIPHKFKFSWPGFKGSSNVQLQHGVITKAVSQIAIGPILIVLGSNDFVLRLSDYAGHSNVTVSALKGLWDGFYSDHVGAIKYSNRAKEMFSVDSLNTYMSTKVTQALLGIVMNFNIGKISIPDEIDIQPMVVKVSIQDLNGPAIVNLTNNASLVKEPSLDEFVSVLTPTTIIKKDFALQTSKGPLVISSVINWQDQILTSFDELPAKTNMQVDVRIGSELLNYIASSIDNKRNAYLGAHPDAAKTDKQIAESFQAQMNEYIAQGYLLKNQNDYISHIVLKAGKMTVNDKEFNSPLTGATESVNSKVTPAYKPAAIILKHDLSNRG